VAALPPQPPGGSTPPQYPPAVPLPGGPPPGARPLPPAPGAYPAAAPGAAPAYGAAAPAAVVRVRRRTGWMVFAQVLAILKSILWLLVGLLIVAGGVYLITIGGDISRLPGYTHYYGSSINGFSAVANAAAAVVIAFGAVCVIIGIVELVLGITVGRPSQVSRWMIIVLDVLSIIGSVANILNTGSRGNGWLLFWIVWLAVDVLILYALTVDGNTRRAFAGLP